LQIFITCADNLADTGLWAFLRKHVIKTLGIGNVSLRYNGAVFFDTGHNFITRSADIDPLEFSDWHMSHQSWRGTTGNEYQNMFRL